MRTSNDQGSRDEPFRAIFEAALDAMLLADDGRRYVDANPAAVRLLGRSREELLTLRIEDLSPMGTDVEASWNAFLAAQEAGGEYQLVRPDGAVVEVEFRATANVLPGVHLSVLRDITARKHVERELQDLNDRLRAAHARERQVALSLQQAMLPAAVTRRDVDVATRYLPAARGIKVCGDWYNVVDLDDERVGVAVGDVMGHGLAAAGVMGQLSSALTAAMYTGNSPAEALATLDTYAGSIGEVLATVVTGVLDLGSRTFTYASAGHPPAVLVDAAGRTRLLDEATSPPLSAPRSPSPRPETTFWLPDAATLIMYTDGLIERRDSDIDEGLRRLESAARRHAGLAAEPMAQALVDDLSDGSIDDDVALVVLRI